MEHFLRHYFDYVNKLPRNSLHDRRTRYQMVDYISALIEGCSKGYNEDKETVAKEAVTTIIRYHDERKSANGKICLMGKYHNILYVAVKLCFLWQLKDIGTITLLLEQIYECEKTFERILIGAIFGTKAPHYIAGWKSDFDDQEENLRAMVFFMDRANNAGLFLPFGEQNKLYRFIDLPIESCGKSSPLKVVVQLGLPDKLLIVLRFGALVYNENDNVHEITIVEHILNRLMEFNHCYPYNLVACVQLLLRAIPSIKVEKNVTIDEESNYQKDFLMENYTDLIVDGIIPLSRCGINPPELKHLCRCSIRQKLWENYQLPDGIMHLPIPEPLRRYLDIMAD